MFASKKSDTSLIQVPFVVMLESLESLLGFKKVNFYSKVFHNKLIMSLFPFIMFCA